MARWSVDIIRKRSEHLGVVVAPNEKEAVAKAIKQFEIEPARQNRITVTKISDRNDADQRRAPRAHFLKRLAATRFWVRANRSRTNVVERDENC
jgi:hypothetical protein